MAKEKVEVSEKYGVKGDFRNERVAVLEIGGSRFESVFSRCLTS